MKAPSMSKDHRRLVGLQAASLQRAQDLERQIADRAAQLEKDLLSEAEQLRKAMAGEESQFRLRRLEAQYLKVMHRLAMVRRSHALAREHGPVDGALSAAGKVSGQAVADAIRKAVSVVLGIPASLLKGRVKGHWRTTESGKMVWVAEHQDKRTKKAPEPTTGRQRSLFDEPEPASGGKPGQASLFGDDEAPAGVEEQPKAKPQDKRPRAPLAKEGLHVKRVSKPGERMENWQVLDGDKVLHSSYSRSGAQQAKRRIETGRAKEAQQPENPAKAAAESVRQRAEGIAEAQGFLKERSRNVYQATAKEDAAERDGKPYNAYDNVSMEELQQIQARQRASAQQGSSPAPKDADTFQQQQQSHNDLANETLRLQKLGEQQIPGIRLADAETAGHLYEMLQAGEIKQQEWDKYVRSVSDQGKVAPDSAAPTVRDKEPEPAADAPKYAIDYHLRDTKGSTYTLEVTGPDRASIVVRDENGKELDRLSPRPTKAAEEDLLKIGSYKWLRKEPGTPEDSAAGLFSPGHKVTLPDGQRGVVVKRDTVHMSAFHGGGVHAVHGYTVRLNDGTEKYTTEELHDEDWEPPKPVETEEEKAKRAAEEAEAKKERRQRIEEEKAKRPEPEWSSFDAGEYRWDNGDMVYYLARGAYDKSYTIHTYNRRTGEYDRSFYGKSWQTQRGAQKYLDRYIANYGTSYRDAEVWKRIDSRTGRPVTERKPKPAQDATTTGTSSAGSTDAAGGAVIRDNPDWGSVEVKFPAKPSDEVRSRLKAEGFKWSGKQGVWYSKRPRAREVATEILGVKKSARRRHPLLGILGGRP